MNVLTLILAGGMGAPLSVLTQQRPRPALPFGGKYRVIDFTLSNLANSNLYRVAVIAQFRSYALIEHLGTGEAWGFDQHALAGIPVWQAYRGRTDRELYAGTADAVYQNRKFILEDGSDTVMILSGDFIYRQDYREMLRFHQESGAGLTILSTPVPEEERRRFGMLAVDARGKILEFVEKPQQAQPYTQGSMGQYVFNTAYLLELLEDDARDPNSQHDFGRNIIPRAVAEGRAYTTSFPGYWIDISSVQQYWAANMDLLKQAPPLDLHDPDWVYATRAVQKAPALVRQPGRVADSLVPDGCVIEGEVIHSVLGPGVRVERGAVVRDSVILRDGIVRAGAVIERCILDEEVEVGRDARLGSGDDLTPNHEQPHFLTTGISIVGQGARIPPGAVIGRNCLVESCVSEGDFADLQVASGESVRRKEAAAVGGLSAPATDQSADQRRGQVKQMLREMIAAILPPVEEGRLGFDHAVREYAQGHDNELARAFAGYVEQLLPDEGGEDFAYKAHLRRKCLRAIAARFDTPEMTGFVESLIRSQDQSISLAKTLQEQARQ